MQIHHVGPAVAKNHIRLMDSVPENIVDIRLHIVLIAREVSSARLGDPTAIEIPAFITVSHFNDIALGKIFLAIFERRVGDCVVLEVTISIEFTGMSELAYASGASDVTNIQVCCAAQPLNRLLQNFLGFRRALRRHHHLGFLRRRFRHNCKKSKYQGGRCRKPARAYPQRTEPPFTLITSPVMKVARSDAAKRMGPAISSAVATRFNAMGARADFIPAFLPSTEADMSVSTQPGATQFTRMLWAANS